MQLKFEVYGLPQGKGAARHSQKGFTYTPTKTRHYMSEVKNAALQAGATPLTCPCSIFIRAFFPIPQSYNKKLQASIREGKVYYSKKPDTDNIGKIKDALNLIAFADDSQVWNEHIIKLYSDRPRLEITIFYFETSLAGALGYAP